MGNSPALNKAVAQLNIADVVVKTVTATLTDGVMPGVNLFLDEETVTQSKPPSCVNLFTYNSRDSENERLLVFELVTGIRLLRGNTEQLQLLNPADFESAVLATIEATFFVSYTEQKLEDEFCDDQCLADFASKNVPFNAWPYWRELIQSACSRLGLPRFVLPMYRIRNAPSIQFEPPALSASATGRS